MTTKLALKKNPFWIALLLYGFAGVLLFKARLHFIHPDGISYISIAEKYANGNFYEALNKCWAVLISWLIAIPLLFGCAPLWAAKMVTLGIGAFALLAARAFAETFDLPRRFKFLMLLALVPAFLSYAFQRVGPDLLLCGFLLFYLSVFFKKDYLSRPANAVFCGIWGAAAYYAKHYALPFFMVHFFCIHLGFLINSSADERKKIVYRWAAGTGVFLILILPWCGALSLKYGTIATAATGPAVFDWKLGGPHGGGYPYSYPYEDQGFFAPSNATAVSFWEDPTDVKLESWSPLDSKESFRHFLQWIRHNFWLTRKFIRGFSPLSPWIFAVSCAALLSTFFSKRVALLRWRLGGLLFTAALNIAGFLLLKVEDRYFYILPVFLMVLCGLILCEIYKRGSIRRQWVQKLVECGLLFSFAFPAAVNLKNMMIYPDYFPMAKKMSEYGIRGKIASNADWANSLILAYYLGSHYYGKTAPGMAPAGIAKELERWKIDYYLVWKEKGSPFIPMPPVKAFKKFEDSGIEVYEIKPA